MSDCRIRTCPFCGADARVNRVPYNGRTHYYVECSNGCVEQIFPFMTEEEAIEEWNKRSIKLPEIFGGWRRQKE